jgi:hypothetical protein
MFDATHHLDWKGMIMTPSLNLGVSTLRGASMTESGAGAQSTTLSSSSQTHVWLEPALAFGFERNLSNERLLRTYARFSVLQHLTDATTEVRAGLVGAPADLAPMRIRSDLGPTHMIAEGGLELVSTDRFTIGLSYATERSDVRDSGTGTIRVVVPVK